MLQITIYTLGTMCLICNVAINSINSPYTSIWNFDIFLNILSYQNLFYDNCFRIAFLDLKMIQDSSISELTGFGLEDWNLIRSKGRDFCFLLATLILGFTQPPAHWLPGFSLHMW
jgi:hypothetical protein